MFNNGHVPPGFVPDNSRGGDGRAGLGRAVWYLLVTGFGALVFYLIQDAFTLGIAILALLGAFVLGAAIMVPVLTRRNKKRSQNSEKHPG
ncbi:hypothetical protein [Arthrobacter crystallopoietes]|uniref:hypothetical protein n=1 Tax=Crystallibacter crystallopoietes TaxID=37928 RepID=UPI001113E43E|nr:hypothetical protein [Arthrobacter crystallopoietes]